jgi:hypothetical protein
VAIVARRHELDANMRGLEAHHGSIGSRRLTNRN